MALKDPSKKKYRWSLDLSKLSFRRRLKFVWDILRGKEATIVFNEDEVADGKGRLSAGGWRQSSDMKWTLEELRTALIEWYVRGAGTPAGIRMSMLARFLDWLEEHDDQENNPP